MVTNSERLRIHVYILEIIDDYYYYYVIRSNGLDSQCRKESDIRIGDKDP